MKKRILSIFCIAALMAACLCVGAVAAGGLEKIQAYLNRDITIKLDGQTQTMYDAQGNRVYPISYNGTTYVPIRAVSNMLDIDVEWDGANNTVLLGETGTAKDFIEDLEPYQDIAFHVNQIADGMTKTIAGKQYNHWIEGKTTGGGYYDLAGKYTKLTFQVYSEIDTPISFYGDNDSLLSVVQVTADKLPTEYYTVDVSGVQQLLICGKDFDKLNWSNYFYIFNATIE